MGAAPASKAEVSGLFLNAVLTLFSAAATDLAHGVMRQRLSKVQQQRFYVGEAMLSYLLGAIALDQFSNQVVALVLLGVTLAGVKGAIKLHFP